MERESKNSGRLFEARPFFFYDTQMIALPDTVRRFAQRYRDAGYRLYVVGGAVRDELLKMKVSDFDFATSAPPDVTQSLFRRTIPTGIDHGTITVLFEGVPYEVTTFRVEGTYGDHRRPDSVHFSDSLHEDLRRRDLTINAMAIDPLTGELHDPFGGRDDLRMRIVRTVGSPAERFGEDALRMVRAIRFVTTLQFDIDTSTRDAIGENAPSIVHVAQERIRQELEKMMAAPRPSVGWSLFSVTGLLEFIMPELLGDRQQHYRERGGPPVFDHLLASCDCAPPDDGILRWAALFHDIGKPATLGHDERGIHFHTHEVVSATMAREIMGRLRFPNDTIRDVEHLVAHHMFDYDTSWSDGAVRRLVSRVGPDSLTRLFALRRIDICGKTGRPGESRELRHLEERIAHLLSGKPPLTTKDLAIDGRDIMELLNIPAGPTIGIILRDLLQTVLDDPATNTYDRLARVARNFYEQRLNTGA